MKKPLATKRHQKKKNQVFKKDFDRSSFINFNSDHISTKSADRISADKRGKPAKLIRIPLYRVDRLAFWQRHAKLDSVDLSKVDLTRHALHPTPRAGQQWKSEAECSPEQMHMHQGTGCNLDTPAPYSTEVTLDVEHETKDFQLNIGSFNNSENFYEEDYQAVNVKSEHEVKLELYEDHIIKEELDIVIGPTVLQIPNIVLVDDRSDELAVNFQRTQKQVTAQNKDQTVKLDTVTTDSKQYNNNVIARVTENLKQNKTENGHRELENSEKASHSVNIPKKAIHVDRQDEDILKKCFICDECEKQFKRKIYLIRHLKSHAGVTYRCDKCDKKYNRKDYLVQHMGQHTGTTFYCDECGKQYNRKDSLFQHMKLHSGTTYNCDKCDKKYNLKKCLDQHMKLHIGTTYCCDKCGKKYIRKDSLVQHMKLHTGTTYNCNKCDKKYNRKKCLFRHMKLHTGTTYDCDKCDKKFNRKYMLVQHIELHR